ncbi:hypothetical protein [Rugamonas sp. DEMB1]|uniref:hypothetical protein n=1 Tax=Rugamonas sp. DEMB1 TaxID=3039386 RepID=UPI00244D1008|nr:hypothetical protein [Rugamonas sp. DEMB1]WGG48170.1 hypothetical protein QC826_15615 [Rugamonas sp. DEMB1]
MVAADGTVMHGLALVYVLRDQPEVKAFKIVQESLQLTRVQLVLEEALTPALRALLEQGLRRRLGAGVSIELEQVERILPEKSGKFRYVSSKVDAARPGGAAP